MQIHLTQESFSCGLDRFGGALTLRVYEYWPGNSRLRSLEALANGLGRPKSLIIRRSLVGLLAHLKCSFFRVENFAPESLAWRPVLGLLFVRFVFQALRILADSFRLGFLLS